MVCGIKEPNIDRGLRGLDWMNRVIGKWIPNVRTVSRQNAKECGKRCQCRVELASMVMTRLSRVANVDNVRAALVAGIESGVKPPHSKRFASSLARCLAGLKLERTYVRCYDF